MPSPFAIEDKYDGIRAQAHVDGDEVRLFSRTLDDITRGYPDVVASLRGLGAGLVLDGELIAVDPVDRRRARPFAALQRRLGRKAPSAAVLDETPVAFVAYDLLATDGDLVSRGRTSDGVANLVALNWLDEGAFVAPNSLCVPRLRVEFGFARSRACRERGTDREGPGVGLFAWPARQEWIKLKRALATLDVVVTGVERGHGRRNHVLSDYTFAVRASDPIPRC